MDKWGGKEKRAGRGRRGIRGRKRNREYKSKHGKMLIGESG